MRQDKGDMGVGEPAAVHIYTQTSALVPSRRPFGINFLLLCHSQQTCPCVLTQNDEFWKCSFRNAYVENKDCKSIQSKIKDLNARLTFHCGSVPTNSKHTSLPLRLINLPSCEIHRVSLDPPPPSSCADEFSYRTYTEYT